MVEYMTNLNWKDVNIYYLNLDRRSDRRKAIENELKRVQLFKNATRIRGVDGSRLKPKVEKDFLRKFETKAKIKERVLGRIGCYLGHIRALKTALKDAYASESRKNKPVLIIEDDCTFQGNAKNYRGQIAGAPKKADMLYLGGLFWLRGEAKRQLTGGSNTDQKTRKFFKPYQVAGSPWMRIDQSNLKIACTLAYMFPDRKSLHRAYRTIKKNTPTAIDIAYINYIQKGGNCYIYQPEICRPELSFTSDVTTFGKTGEKNPYSNSYTT